MTAAAEQRASVASCFWPNKLGRILLLSLQDIMGREALHAVLSHAKLRHLINNYPPDNLDLACRFDEISAIGAALDGVCGEQAARALSIRAGRVAFHYFLDDLGSVLGAAPLAFRVLPLGRRIGSCLEAIADTFNKTSDQMVRIEEEAERFLFHVERCPLCWGRRSGDPVCHLYLGLLDEALYWATSGRSVRVEEIRCLAMGEPACTLSADKIPLCS